MKKEIFIGKVGIGGKNPITIQSMTSTLTSNVEKTLKQIHELSSAGCDIVRVAVPDQNCLISFGKIVDGSPLPIIADIHFNADLAIKAIELGARGIRINPGNIKNRIKIKEILKTASEHKTPIRIGVNWGSIDKKKIDPTKSKAHNMVEHALNYIRFFEDQGFDLIKVSLKSSDIHDTVEAYTLMDQKSNYPLHLGITEAGTFISGTVKSAIGIGSLLLKGIGNTFRVSLTADPVEEIPIAREILKVLNLNQAGFDIISCPTCSRTVPKFIPLVKEIEKKIKDIKIDKKIKIAIMGCEVNGPGEAKEADLGIAFSNNRGYIFKNSKIIEKVAPEEAVQKFIGHLRKIL